MKKQYNSPTLRRLQLQISEQEKLEMILEEERRRAEIRECREIAERIRQEEEDWN